MHLRTRLSALLLAPLLFGACLAKITQPEGTPLDCHTLATSLGTATDLTTTESGLRYRDVTVGSGSVVVAAGTGVGIFYSGCLTTGVQFDARLDNQFPFEFRVGTTPLSVISGFDEGLRGMRSGGLRQIVIPPELAYGDQPVRNGNEEIVIPANSTLVFTVDLRGTF